MESRIKFRFGQVEEALAEFHRIEVSREPAFRAKLKKFKRVGLDVGESTPGRRANLTIVDALSLALALEVSRFGTTPERTVQLLRRGDASFRLACSLVLASKPKSDPILIAYFPDAWSDDPADTVERDPFACFPAALFGTPMRNWFLSGYTSVGIINASAVISRLFEHLVSEGERASAHEELRIWAGDDVDSIASLEAIEQRWRAE